MTTEQVKEVLDRVLTWPTNRQEVAASILVEMEEQDQSPYSLTDEQVAEVRRRLADQNDKSISLEEARRRFGL